MFRTPGSTVRSHNSSLRVAKPAFARAKRRWARVSLSCIVFQRVLSEVLSYARKVLKDANSRLAEGEESCIYIAKCMLFDLDFTPV